jgi:hypothetical protein
MALGSGVVLRGDIKPGDDDRPDKRGIGVADERHAVEVAATHRSASPRCQR